MTTKSATWRPGATVCRCCLAEGCYKDIATEYFWMGKREVYSEMLSDTFDVSIAYSQAGGPNSNSRLICEPCISRLRDASEFKRQVQDCEKTFMQYLEPGSSAATEVNVSESSEKDVKIEDVKKEKEESDDEDYGLPDDFPDDDDDDIDDQPLTTLASKVPKKEEEPVDLLDFLDPPKVAEKRKSAAKAKSSPAKKAKTTEATASVSNAKSEKKKKGEDEEETTLDLVSCLGEDKEETMLDTTRENSMIILKHSTAYPFTLTGRNLVKCSFCAKAFENPVDFRNHVDYQHKEVDRSTAFGRKNVIRVDITGLRCKRCKKLFDSLEMLSKHLKDEHDLDIEARPNFALVPMKLVKDRYVCIICEKKFTGLKELSKHSGTHFKRFICDVCGRNFETRMGLHDHTKIKHSKDIKYYCRPCKGNFPSKEAKKAHVRENKACMPFRCIYCEERYMFWEAREQHMVEMHGHSKKTYPCTECEKIFEKRTLYYLHFKAAHTNDIKCQYCEQSFATRGRLQDHSVRHTGERPYKCSYCDKDFATPRNLRQHTVIHDDSKKHGCSVCSRLFTGRTKLKAHLKRQHPDTFDQMFS